MLQPKRTDTAALRRPTTGSMCIWLHFPPVSDTAELTQSFLSSARLYNGIILPVIVGYIYSSNNNATSWAVGSLSAPQWIGISCNPTGKPFVCSFMWSVVRFFILWSPYLDNTLQHTQDNSSSRTAAAKSMSPATTVWTSHPWLRPTTSSCWSSRMSPSAPVANMRRLSAHRVRRSLHSLT